MKPLILITPNIENNTISINKDYVKAVELAGGVPLLITYNDLSNIHNYLDLCNGILLSGGGDINKKYFRCKDFNNCDFVPLIRDEFEFKLIQRCVQKNIPLLCICRGIQVLNVALGGTIIQDINEHLQQTPRNQTHHNITIKAKTFLYEAIKNEQISVNSIHHQVVDKLGYNLISNCVSDDGYIEGIELKDNKFVVGVQWHPESLVSNCLYNFSIFKKFIDSCK